MFSKSKVLGVLAGVLFGVVAATAPASADIVTVSLPDFNGSFHNSGFPFNFGTVGTFNYAIPGAATITSVTLSGTDGTQAYPYSTASFDVVLEGQQVTMCAVNAACWFDSTAYRPLSVAFPGFIFAALLDGSADLGIIQTSGNYIRFGSPTLTIEYTAADVPEPAAAALFLIGLAGAARARRRKS